MSTKEKYKALISTLLNAWGGKATVKSAKSVEINGTAHNPAAVVVKTWSNGTSWYRKYSDGWIEQGGYVSSGGNSSAFYTGTFNIAFSTTNITLVATNAYRENINKEWYGQIGAFVVSATQFKETSYAGEKHPFHWYACGK